MNELRRVDPKTLALVLGVGIAGVLVGAIITWALTALETGQIYGEPTVEVIQEENLLGRE